MPRGASCPNLNGPADLAGPRRRRSSSSWPREIRETIIDDGGRHRRPPRQLARRRRAHDRPPSAPRVAARPDRLGHRPPGLPAQAADRPARAVRHAPPARRRRRVPAPHRSRRTTCSTAVMPGPGSRSPRASPRRATCAHGIERIAVVVGDAALMSGLSLEALNDIGQRQTRMLIVLNDNEMSISPTVGALSKYLSHDQALAALAASRTRLRPDRSSGCPFIGADRARAVAAAAPVGRQLRPARAAVRGPRDHLRRGRARATTCSAARGTLGRALRAARARSSSTSGPRRAAATGRPRRTRSASTARRCRR